MDAFDFLGSPEKAAMGDVVVLIGRTWLADLVYQACRAAWGIQDIEECLPGQWRDCAEEGSLFGPRILVVNEADGQEKSLRDWLRGRREISHRLLLRVSAWKGKPTGEFLLDCSSMRPDHLDAWAIRQAGKAGLGISRDALSELRSMNLDLYAVNLEKSICAALGKSAISAEDVRDVCHEPIQGQAWQILSALDDPDRLWSLTWTVLGDGEGAFLVWGAIAGQLRRCVRAVQLRRLGRSAAEAMKQAGIPSHQMADAAKIIGHLRTRLNQVLDWLLEAEAGLKGQGTLAGLKARTICERLIFLLGRP